MVIQFQMFIPEKNAHNIIHTEQVVLLYVGTHMNASYVTTSRKRGCEFENEQREIYGRGWREETEEESAIIAAYSPKIKGRIE